MISSRLLVLALVASAWSIQFPIPTTQSLPSLHLTLAPFYASSSLQYPQPNVKTTPEIPLGINITMTLSNRHFYPSDAFLQLGLMIGVTPTARYDGNAITASDSTGPIPLRYNSTAAPDEMRTWFLTRQPKGDITVTFFAPKRKTDKNTLIGPRVDLRGDIGGGLVGQGMGFIPVVPKVGERDVWDVSVEWDLNSAPEGTHGATSHGDEGVSHAVGELDRVLASCIFAVGLLMRFPDWSSPSSSISQKEGRRGKAPFAIYWLGTPPFNMDQTPTVTENVYRAIAAYFGSSDPFRVFFRGIENGNGGTGAFLSFLLEYSPESGDEMNSDELIDLLAHETVHEYALLGSEPRTDPDPEEAWYDEGIASYLGAIASFRGGAISRSILIDFLNGYAQAYYTSPAIHLKMDYVLAHFWDSLHVTRVVYYRGVMYLALVNGLVRDATGGEKGVDDVVLELYWRRMANEAHDIPTYHSLVAALIGSSVEESTYDAMLRGDLIVPSANCFEDLGLKLVRQDAEIFDLGFDPNSLRGMVIKGLVSGSRAEKAGVQEGDEVVHSFMAWGAADHFKGMMEMTVKRGKEEVMIRWWPRGWEKVENWMWIDDSESEEVERQEEL